MRVHQHFAFHDPVRLARQVNRYCAFAQNKGALVIEVDSWRGPQVGHVRCVTLEASPPVMITLVQEADRVRAALTAEEVAAPE